MTFSSAVRLGSRWYDWNTNPTRAARNWARPSSSSAESSVPSKNTWPVVGRSRPASRPSRVDLPAPEAPTTATASPGKMLRSIPASRVSSPSGLAGRFVSFRAGLIGCSTVTAPLSSSSNSAATTACVAWRWRKWRPISTASLPAHRRAAPACCCWACACPPTMGRAIPSRFTTPMPNLPPATALRWCLSCWTASSSNTMRFSPTAFIPPPPCSRVYSTMSGRLCCPCYRRPALRGLRRLLLLLRALRSTAASALISVVKNDTMQTARCSRECHRHTLWWIAMRRVEKILETIIFNSRWLLAPFYVGLVFSIMVLLAKFLQEFLHFAPEVLEDNESAAILSMHTLVDMALVANLLIIIIFSGYENFVSKIDAAGHEDRPDWMGKVDFSALKLKLIASIVAISAIELLKAFVNMQDILAQPSGERQLMWKVGIHMVLVLSGVLFALMDRMSGDKDDSH